MSLLKKLLKMKNKKNHQRKIKVIREDKKAPKKEKLLKKIKSRQKRWKFVKEDELASKCLMTWLRQTRVTTAWPPLIRAKYQSKLNNLDQIYPYQ